jgi:hypothetical protein
LELGRKKGTKRTENNEEIEEKDYNAKIQRLY